MPIYRTLIAAGCLALSIGACAQTDTSMTATPSEEWPDTVYVTMTTSKGEILIELNHEYAPATVENFVGYLEDGTYDGTVFHRVIDGFMIQGGGFAPDGIKKDTRNPIVNEWRNGLANLRGTISMARLGGNPNSATNQFFINVNDNHNLDQPQGDGAAYAVFGEVLEGMDVVDAIKNVSTGSRQTPQGTMRDWPTENVTIEKVELMPESEAAELRAEREQEAQDRWESQLEEAKVFIQNELGHDPSEGAFDEELGLWVLEIEDGDGAMPAVTDTVVVHYTGWLTKGGTPFDSSRNSNTPAEFVLNQVIKGWQNAVGSMEDGARRIVVIPTELAYFKRGARNGARTIIPPDSALVFDIELMDVKTAGSALPE